MVEDDENAIAADIEARVGLSMCETKERSKLLISSCQSSGACLRL
jgi:hypothetical protein